MGIPDSQALRGLSIKQFGRHAHLGEDARSSVVDHWSAALLGVGDRTTTGLVGPRSESRRDRAAPPRLGCRTGDRTRTQHAGEPPRPAA